jgi:hypothetical protein
MNISEIMIFIGAMIMVGLGLKMKAAQRAEIQANELKLKEQLKRFDDLEKVRLEQVEELLEKKEEYEEAKSKITVMRVYDGNDDGSDTDGKSE